MPAAASKSAKKPATPTKSPVKKIENKKAVEFVAE